MLSIPRVAPREIQFRPPSFLRRALLLTLLFHCVLFVAWPPSLSSPRRAREPMPVVVLQEVGETAYTILDTPADEPETPMPPPDRRPDSDVPEPPTVGLGEYAIQPPTLAPEASSNFIAVDRLPTAIRLVTPDYPPLAREAGIEGTVRVKVVIDDDGKVIDLQVIWSDVTASMERAAIAAAKRSRFEPGRQGLHPVRAAVVIPFRFRLTDR